MSGLGALAAQWWSVHGSIFLQVGVVLLLAGCLELVIPAPEARSRLWRVAQGKLWILLLWPWPLALGFGAEAAAPSSGRAVAGPAGVDWITLGFLSWSLGVCVLTCRLGIGARRIQRLLRAAEPLELCSTHATLDALAASLRVSSPRLAVLRGLPSPVLVGFGRGTILLPRDFRHQSHLLQRAMLAHELAHVHRRDPSWRLLASVVRILLWTQPLLWWYRGRVEQAEEAACDRLAVRVTGIAAQQYGRVLFDAYTRTGDLPLPPRSLAPATAGGSRDCLRRRLRALAGPRRPEGMPKWALGLVLLGSCPVALESAPSPRIFIRLQEAGAEIVVIAEPDPGAGILFTVDRSFGVAPVRHRVAGLHELGERDPEARRVLERCVRRKPERSWLFGTD